MPGRDLSGAASLQKRDEGSDMTRPLRAPLGGYPCSVVRRGNLRYPIAVARGASVDTPHALQE